LSNYHDHELKTIKAAIEVNIQQKKKLIKKARKYYEDLADLTVAVLGLAFKPGTDDLREAPALDNIPILLDYGAKIKAWDPVAAENFRMRFPEGIAYCGSVREALDGADICFIFTDGKT
jgi:UDPglucose 6-dehydrogenase